MEFIEREEGGSLGRKKGRINKNKKTVLTDESRSMAASKLVSHRRLVVFGLPRSETQVPAPGLIPESMKKVSSFIISIDR